MRYVIVYADGKVGDFHPWEKVLFHLRLNADMIRRGDPRRAIRVDGIIGTDRAYARVLILGSP